MGALHAVLARACPGVERIDLAHDVPPGDVRWGAILLARLAPLLPGAVHLAVVDPGVGTGRPAAAVALPDGGALVGPDEGLLGLAARALGATAAVALLPPPDAAATFHGRDLFAPAAARLARGEPLRALGPPRVVAGIAAPHLPPPRVGPGRLAAEVAGVDRFGNAALLAGAGDLEAAGLLPGVPVRVEAPSGHHPAVVGRAFADVPPGALVVHLDSHGMVAVALNRGDAAARLGAGPGARVALARAIAGGVAE